MSHADAFDPNLPVYRNLVRTEDQRRWLRSLPDLVAEFERRWSVTTGPPYRSGTSAWTAPGRTADGRAVVLKLVWPHPEASGEAPGLHAWNGDGAVRLYDADPDRFALLLERCEPGTALGEAGPPPTEALMIATGLLARLWAAHLPQPSRLERLDAMMARWAAEGFERWERYRPPFDAGLVESGLTLLGSLPRSATREVVLHGDLNPGNVLRARRRPWLAIDPKPMTGDPGFDLDPLLCQIDPPYQKEFPAAAVKERCALLEEVLGVPEERIVAWAFARSVQSALWCVAHGRDRDGQEDMADATVLASLDQL